ncbi:MAG: T9SS type A sorting domain-containing protein [Chitinophagales bacterium]|nr:T9SS type A sorting domain-containing protein [Chitinophagales bacterium]
MDGQIYVLDFDTDIGGGNGCTFNVPLIEDGHVFMKNPFNMMQSPDIPVLSLSGEQNVHNYLTNTDCDTWLYEPSLFIGSSTIPVDNNRKMIVQKNMNIGLNGSFYGTSLNGQMGILLNIPDRFLRNNFFYQVQFDMHQIFNKNCSEIDESTGVYTIHPRTPTINVYHNYKYDSTNDGFIEKEANHNNTFKSMNNRIGQFTTNGKKYGVYRSDAYQFNTYGIPEEESEHQLAFFVTAESAGDCDKPGGTTFKGPLSEYGMAALLDNITVDCDRKNVAFFLNVTKVKPSDLSSCDYEHLYKVTLETDCSNVVKSLFFYDLIVTNEQGEIVRSYVNQNRSALYVDLDGLLDGEYTFSITYNNWNGYNNLVKEFGFDEERQSQKVQLTTGSHVVDGTETFAGNTYIPSGIVIMPGGELTVSGTVYMKDNTLIQVKDGGKLRVTSTGHLTACENEWWGVNMTGSGEVSIQGALSRSVYGIKTYASDQGKIHTDGASFFDNRTTDIDASGSVEVVVKNTEFIGGQRGVVLNFVTEGTTPNGVLFEGNQFSYQSKEGILAVGTPINVVNGNKFYFCGDGIAIRNLFGGDADAIIGDKYYNAVNEFAYCNNGIYANNGQQGVQYNNFVGNYYSTWLSGINKYFSENNTFAGEFCSEVVQDMGAYVNKSQYNSYTSQFGIAASGANDNFEMLSHCFNNSVVDIIINGTVSMTQGGEKAASNCFTKGSTLDFVQWYPQPVIYYMPEDMMSTPVCFEPEYPGYYSLRYESKGYDNYCNQGNGANIYDPYEYIKNIGCDSTRLLPLLRYYSRLNRELEMRALGRELTENEKIQKSKIGKLWRTALYQWTKCLLTEKRYPELYELYKEQEDKDFSIKAVEVLVKMQLYDEAKEELSEIGELYEINPDILSSIELSIDYLSQNLNKAFELSDIQLLRSVAATADPYAAYGRALLYLVTGERVEPEYEIFNISPRVESRSSTEAEIITIRPNPASDLLQIDIENYQQGQLYQYKIQNAFGVTVMTDKIDQSSMLHISHIPAGVYFVRLYSGDKLMKTEKVVITH